MSTTKDFISYVNTTQIHRVTGALSVILLAVGIAVGFTIASSNARQESEDAASHQLAVFSKWQLDLTSQLTEASSLASTLGAFVMATEMTPANMTASAASRKKYLDPDAFQRLGKKVFVKGIGSLNIAPGGVVCQMYPQNTSQNGLDLSRSSSYRRLFRTFYNASGVVTSGPLNLTAAAGYGLFVWFPVHVSNVPSVSSFWGLAYVIIEIETMIASLNLTATMMAQNMDFAIWFTLDTDNYTVPTIIAQSDPSVTGMVLSSGMRATLPISEEGKTSYLAIYPKGGPVSSSIKTEVAILIVGITLLGLSVVVAAIYISAFAHFHFRHRQAPANHSQMYIAALALRGAQPFADRAPLVAVRMFNDFTAAVHKLAIANGCYPVCNIGDRCVYVVAKDPQRLLQLAQSTVLSITVTGNLHSADLKTKRSSFVRTAYGTNNTGEGTVKSATIKSAKSIDGNKTAIDDDATESSFIGAASCYASVACHTVAAECVYDEEKDLYFYGSSAQLGKLCGSLDLAKCGEVCWTDAFENADPKLCRGAASGALASHTVSEKGEVALHVASWWKESGDERDNEDPSTAMAALSDAYVRRMTVIVSQGRSDAKNRRRKEGDETKSGGSSNQSNEATFLTRNATLLHVAIMNGDEKTSLETVRRIVLEEKGFIVSAHGAKIVAAYNLLSSGGHHQVRAADTVMRIRGALPSTQFACSLTHGKINGHVIDGLVMCTGDAVVKGWALLNAAIALSTDKSKVRTSSFADSGLDKVTYLCSSSSEITSPSTSEPPKLFAASINKRVSAIPMGEDLDHGLCLLLCHEELTSTYETEAVDVATFETSQQPMVVYRLAHRKSNKITDDEWMYRLKDDEDQSPFSAVNAILCKIADGDREGAAALWKKFGTMTNPLETQIEISPYAKAAITRLLISK